MTKTDDPKALVEQLREPYTQDQSRRVSTEVAAADRIEALETERDELRQTIDRCWKALGIATYEEADGKAIWELIEVAVKEIDGG